MIGRVRSKLSIWLLAWLLVCTAAAEVGVRLGGIVEFPVYDSNSPLGCIPKANQQGRFLNKNVWVINAQHVGAEVFVPDPVANTLLISDSLVCGGESYARADRLGLQLQRQVSGRVWPIAASSWAPQNELTYLNVHPMWCPKWTASPSCSTAATWARHCPGATPQATCVNA